MEEKKNISVSSRVSLNFEDIAIKIDTIAEYITKSNLRTEIDSLQTQCESENLWEDSVNASKIMQEHSRKKNFVDDFESYKKENESLISLFEDIKDEDSMVEEMYVESKQLLIKVDKMYIETLFGDKYDDYPCFVTITAGSGGMEAQDWASMLFGMYYNFGKQNYTAEVIEYSDKDVGIKSGVIRISGSASTFPYGRLKGENGVHRLVRPSPFNANNNRHTSFASVIVSPVIDDTISIVVLESDLRIDTYRASGAGGQHVNKTDSAVRLTHIPTGVVVQCQNDRSQHRNKAEAMKMLRSRLYMLAEEEKRKTIDSTQKSSISWGNQIRSYVLDDSRVKDLRTNVESSQPDKILSGDINEFLDAYIKWNVGR